MALGLVCVFFRALGSCVACRWGWVRVALSIRFFLGFRIFFCYHVKVFEACLINPFLF